MPKIQRHYVHLLVLAGILAACTSAVRVDTRTEEEAIRELDRKIVAAAKAKDAAAFASYFAENGVLMPSNGAQVTGREAIQTFWSDFLKTPNATMSFTPTRIEVSQAGDMAYDIGTYSFGMDTPQGRFEDEGKYATVWKKINGEWKIAVDVGNSNKPLPAPTPTVSEAQGALAAPAAVAPMATHAHAAELVWKDSPPSMPRGAKMAILEGNPMEPGPFTFRLKFPDNYGVPPHFHPNVEHVTVLSGTFHLGTGDTYDASKFTTMVAGDFLYMTPGTRHFAHAKGETVIQIHSVGPWSITYVNAKDDPRNKP
ncbi:MAG: SgcJ/EcaC family oxidoreductase [Gemmatimonadaceae bacterium]